MNKNSQDLPEDHSEAEIQARRDAVKKMLTVAAAAPMAAMLFDPKKALAAGEGSGTEEP